jgi:hypothetical protein
MSLRISNGSSGVPDQNLDSKASQANSSPPQPDFPDFKVATPSSQHATAAPLKKTPRRKTSKSPAPDRTAYETASWPKLPFKFADQEFSKAVIVQIINACATKDGRTNGPMFDSMISVMLGESPKDPFQVMLTNHMTGFNSLIMEYIGRLSRADNLEAIELYERTLNKLGRTFASYVDVLHRCYRSSGEQKLMVQQNVSVSDGGQAIVANVAQNTGVADNKTNSAPAMIADQRDAPMPVIEPNEQPVPVSVERRSLR